jgi:hypothetical protein
MSTRYPPKPKYDPKDDQDQKQDQDQDQKQDQLQAQLQGQAQGQAQGQGQFQFAAQSLDSKVDIENDNKNENENENKNENSNDIKNELDNKVDNDVDNKLDNEVDNKIDNSIDNKVENTVENKVDVKVDVDIDIDLDGYVPHDDDIIDIEEICGIDGSVVMPDAVHQALSGSGNQFNIDQVNNLVDHDWLNDPKVSAEDGKFEWDAKGDGGWVHVGTADVAMDGDRSSFGDAITSSADAIVTQEAFTQNIVMGANIQFNSIEMANSVDVPDDPSI